LDFNKKIDFRIFSVVVFTLVDFSLAAGRVDLFQRKRWRVAKVFPAS
jgi:hypothetical protein